MMSYPVIKTKVIIPRRQKDLLSRHRLLNMLADLLDYRLTLISGPAGYGKTSLLVDLASRVEYPVCWLSLDSLDQDPRRFIAHLVAAINLQFEDFGASSRSLLSSSEGRTWDPVQIAGTIVNDLYENVEEHFALVLDDFHLVDPSPEINIFINQFVQEVDENCHLVIATRTLLSLPDLPLMVGRAQVRGLSFEELAFNAGEIKTLIETRYGRMLSNQEADNLAEETDGWITGLLLSARILGAGISSLEQTARAAGVDLYDYLARQVLDLQTTELKGFLLQTSFLEEFNAELCQEVFGYPPAGTSWAELIETLLQLNLFVQPLESDGTWLRYHHLFRDFLQHQYREVKPQETRDLLKKLMLIYQDRRWWEKAYAVCRELEDTELLSDMIQSASSDLIHAGRISLLASWLADLPDDLVLNSPGLLMMKGALAAMLGETQAGLDSLNRAWTLAQKDDPQLAAVVLLRRATSYRLLGNFAQGLSDARQSLDSLQRLAPESPLVAEIEREIGLSSRHLGQAAEARTHLKRSLDAYRSQEDQKNSALIEMDLGLMEMTGGNYLEARGLYEIAYSRWEVLGNLSQLVLLTNNLGVLEHLLGGYQKAHYWFNESLRYAGKTGNLRGTAYTMASLADLALDLGSLTGAVAYLMKAKDLAEQIGDAFLQIYLQFTDLRVARIQGLKMRSDVTLELIGIQIEQYPPGREIGRYDLERGLQYISGSNTSNAAAAFRSAVDGFSSSDLPVETAIALLCLVWAELMEGEASRAAGNLDKVRQIIESLGTLQPIIPRLSEHSDCLKTLGDHYPDEPFVSDLIEDVAEFRLIQPELLRELDFPSEDPESKPRRGLEISGLGRVSLSRNGELVEVPEWTNQRTVRELLYYLLSRSDGASREEICLVFWPDSPGEKLKKQFKNALYRLRRAVGKDTILYHQPTRLYHFNRDIDYCYDVEEFLAAANLAELETDLDRKIALSSHAADLYLHPFAESLEGTWSEPVRYQLYRRYERLMLSLAELQLETGKSVEALETSEMLLKNMPSQEEAWRLAMRSHAALGDRGGIKRVFQQCRRILALDLNAEPSPETQDLYRKLMI